MVGLNSMDFVSQFIPYSFPLLGLVRLPQVSISDEDKGKIGLKPNVSNSLYLKRLAWTGYQEKLKSGRFAGFSESQVKERLSTEFAVFEKTGIIDYLLLIWDILKWCDKENIARGPGRGSVCGSLSCYFLGITKVDPLKYKLNFTRFISEARAKPKVIDGITYADGKGMCDIDSDISFVDRPRVIKYIEDKYPGRTCKISTRLQLTGKTALKDVLKVYSGYNEITSKHITDLVEVKYGKVEDLSKSKGLESWIKENKNHQEAFDIARSIEGINIAKGQHPSGILISYHLLDGNIPIELSKTKEITISYDMHIASILAIKGDFLGLRALDCISETARQVGINPDDIDVEDKSIYEYLGRTNLYYGLFQIEGGLTKEVAYKVSPRCITDLCACLALSRPGALRYKDDFVKYVKEGIFKPIYPSIDEILKPTGNILIYQEQVNEIGQKVYKMSPVDADEVRRCVTADTRFVSKTRGWISIKKLLNDGYKDDLFLVMDERGKQIWKPVREIWSNGTKTAKYMRARNGMFIRASRHHQFFTDKGWKSKAYVKEDDYLVCAKSISYDGEDKISSNLAVIIAGLLTEGYFVEQHSFATFVNWDMELMSIFCNSYISEFGPDRLSLSADKRIARIRAKEKRILGSILSFGKSRTKCIPEVMMGMTLETTRKFLGFMFACEATVRDTELSLTSASFQMIQQIQLLLLRFDVRSNVMKKLNPKYNRYYYTLDIGQHKDVVQFFNNFSEYIGKSKREILEKYAHRETIENMTTDIIPKFLIERFKNQYGFLFNYECVRCYSECMSRSKFKRFAAASKDLYWIDIANGKQEFSLLESKEDLYDREAEVFDFTVDEDTPYIIANGMVIHNCIGKKVKEDMAKWEPVLYSNGKIQGIPEHITKYFWDVCNASSDYLFSLNHCAGYSFITAQTAYLKANHPKEFILSLLKLSKHEPDSSSVVASIVSEAKQLGISILPPSITKSGDDFSIDGDGIRFGLSHIRGISEATMSKLVSFRRDFANKFQIFNAAQEAKIPISVLTGLIFSGTIESNVKRSRLALEAQVYNLLTDREKILVNQVLQNNMCETDDLLDILVCLKDRTNEKGKLYIRESRWATFMKEYLPYKHMYLENSKSDDLASYLFERHFLGWSYSNTLHSLFSKRVDGLSSVRQVVDYEKDARVRFAAFVDESKKTISKNKKEYLKFYVSDETGSLKAMLFGDDRINSCEQFNGHLPNEGEIIIIHGKKADGDAVFIDSLTIQTNPILLKKDKKHELS